MMAKNKGEQLSLFGSQDRKINRQTEALRDYNYKCVIKVFLNNLPIVLLYFNAS